MPRQAVLIMCDTQRPDMLGCYGNGDMKTPFIDALAAEGVRFEKAYTCQPVCGPARSALFTGLYPHTNGVWGNCAALGDNIKSVGQRLSREGVPCAYIGKWHLDGGDYFGLGRCPEGWDQDYWYDMRNYLEELPSDEERVRMRSSASMRAPGGVKAEETYAFRCASRAIEYIEKHKDGDFFLVVSFDEPHGPSLCPEPYASMYKDYQWPAGESWNQPPETLPHHIRVWAEGREASDTFYSPYFLGCNSFMDAQTGRVLGAIERFAPRAMTVYTSDHGDAMGAHRISNKGPAMYEEVTRIPLIVRAPDAPRGAVCEHLASQIDMTPTMLDYFGIEKALWCDGESMLPLFYHPEKPLREQVFIEFGRYEVDHDGFGGFQPVRAVTDGHYKLSVNLLSDDEFYDLESDPREMKNLINDPEYAKRRDALHDKLLDWMNESRDPFRGYYWRLRPWRRDAAPASWEDSGYTRQRDHMPFEDRQLDYATGLEIKETTRMKS